MNSELKYCVKVMCGLACFGLVIVLMLGGCRKKVAPYYESSGVRISGYREDGYIRNDNQFPVRIKQVRRSISRKYKRTEWVEVFQPNRIKQQYMSPQHGWHIYDMNGVEIGWLEPSDLMLEYRM